MFKSLSKSVRLMFVYDLAVFLLSALFFCEYFNFQINYEFITVLLIVITGLICLYLKGNYKIREFNVTIWNAYRLFEGVIFAHIPALIFHFFFINKLILLKFAVFDIICVSSFLYLYRLGFHFYLFNIKKVKKVLIIGENERAKAIEEVIKNKKALQMEVIGIVKQGENILDNIKNADIVIFTRKQDFINNLPSNVKYYLMSDFYEMATGKYYIDDETLSEFSYELIKQPKEFYELYKRRFEVIFSLIILVVTLPITCFVALKVMLTDGKSPFYTQDRVGKDGKIFKAYKLRTMYDNDFKPKDNKKVGYVENQDEDDRVIPWCKFVRKARFDEIPQMVNIIKGDMSIVGPRCEWKELAEVYLKEVKGYKNRMLVNTGWTGWAQINQGYCFASDIEAVKVKLQYDLYYIKYRNLFWDLAILVKAIFLALGGRHA